jgi:cyanobactin maturation PatA/PatG family protease
VATLTAGLTAITALPGFQSLWAETLGDPHICIAVLDGPVDQSHPCFKDAQLTQLQTLTSGVANQGWASQHGTHVASIIFGKHGSSVSGIAPGCRGLIVPIFQDGAAGSLAPCSQIDLARAITQAVEQGAHVINISGGQLASGGEPDSLLANAVRLCADNNVLIVAAAGNDRCDCLHVPAAIASVLAVGAMDAQGKPIEFSNWGEAYQSQGVLALGEHILGATPGNGTALKTGTSFATPIVSSVVALLLSLQLKRGEKLDPHAIRTAILKSALPCNQQKSLDIRRCLVGSMSISGAHALITKRGIESMSMSEQKIEEAVIQPNEVSPIGYEIFNQNNGIGQLQSSEAANLSLEQPALQPSTIGLQAIDRQTSGSTSPAMSIGESPMTVTPGYTASQSITPSGASGDCGCGSGGAPQIVYALGELGTDFGTEARRDSFTQAMPSDDTSLLDYLNQNPWEAQSLIWTLNLDVTPIYAIVPSGAYASVTYDRLRSFLADTNVKRVSIPGYIGGSVRLMSGQVVPAIVPEVRGMYSWSVPALVTLATGMTSPPEGVTAEQLSSRIEDYVNRVYYDYRNLGVTPQERALNFSATNAVQASTAIATAAGEQRVLGTISVEKSPICRPDSDCYDVKLSFFDPENNQRSNRVFRFTIDVSDVIPVTIGQVRSWSQS